MKKWLNKQQSSLLAVGLGAILTFAFAPYEIYPLAILAPAGLYALIYRQSPQRAFWTGLWFGVGMFGVGTSWVYISIHQFGDVPLIGAAILTALMTFILALYPALTCYLSNRFFPVTHDDRFNFAFPAIWVFMEWVRGMLFSGFTWLYIGYSQTNSPLSGYAPIFGVYGTSLAAMLCSTLIVNASVSYQNKRYQSLYQSLLSLTLILLMGSATSLINWTHNTDKPVKVSLVQGDIPQSLKWNPDDISLSYQRYQQLTLPLLKKDRIIIWPEAAIPVPLQQTTDFINALDEKAADVGAHILLGIPLQNTKGDGYFNSLVSLGKDRNIYIKRQLVPFGEYIPLQNRLGSLMKIIDVPIPDTRAGRFDQGPMKVGDVEILPSICYEITFPDLMRTKNKSVGLLLTVTNDAWFGKSNAQAQHLQMAAMRAIEMRRPLLFVSNDGITAVINADGKVTDAAPPFVPYVLNATVQPKTGLTPWMTNGSEPMLFILIALAAITKLSSRQLAENEQDETTLTSRT